MSCKMTREKAVKKFGIEKVEEVEKMDADFVCFEGDEERWVSSLEVPGGWLNAVYYQPQGLGDVHGFGSEAAERAQQELEDADWTPDHFDYVED